MIDSLRTDVEQSKLIVRRFAFFRAAIVLVLLLLCSALHLRSSAELDLNTVYLYAIMFVALIESVVIMIVMANGHVPGIRFSFLLLCADLTLISAVVALTGGSRSMFAFLYIAAILSANILFSFNWAMLMATVSAVLFVVVMCLERNGYVMPASAFRWQEYPLVPGDMWAYAGMKVFAFYLTAFLAGHLSRRVGQLQSLQHNILNNFSSGFISVNRDCIVTFLNPAGSALLQRSLSETVGAHVSSAFPVTDEQSNPLEDAIDKRKECQSREIMVRRGDGKEVPVGVTVSLIKDSAGRLVGAVASFVNLTELKRMEEQLRRADTMAAIGEMSTILAHEIRNPVASIRGAVQELSENLRPGGADGRLMKIAIRASDQLNKIISEFLEFAGIKPRERQRFNVGHLLEEVAQTAERRFGCNGNIRIIREYSDSERSVIGDRNQIKQAVLNVVQNGIEAMPEGGALRIGAREDKKSLENIAILIEDDGSGLSRQEIDRIFDPFYTTKRGGVGLGMAIVHRIVASHGGTIEVESGNGKGTAITILLPGQDQR